MPAVVMLVSQSALAQTPPPAWNMAPLFRYNIENILVNTTVTGTWNVKVIFSITDPTTGSAWDIHTRCPPKHRSRPDAGHRLGSKHRLH